MLFMIKVNFFYQFLLIDAISASHFVDEVEVLGTKNESFYKGDKEENRKASPYFFELNEGSPFAQWYFRHGWGQGWGVPLLSDASFEEVYRHFRKFLMVKTEEGEKLYFRFYDPRVLRIFLPTCDAAQLAEFFGPVKMFFCEDEDPQFALGFSLVEGRLVTMKGKAPQI